MSKRFLYFDPFTGISHYHDYDPILRKGYHITEGDSEANVEHSKALRNDDDYKKDSIKNGGMHVIHWPPMVQAEVLQKFGVDVVTQPREAIAIAIEHYPDCLTVPVSALKGWRKYKKVFTVG